MIACFCWDALSTMFTFVPFPTLSCRSSEPQLFASFDFQTCGQCLCQRYESEPGHVRLLTVLVLPVVDGSRVAKWGLQLVLNRTSSSRLFASLACVSRNLLS